MKGDARGLMIGGLAMFGAGAISAVGAIMNGGMTDPGMMSALGTLAAMGTGMLGAGALRLPGWARLRRRQMEQIATRVTVAQSAGRLPDIHEES